MRNQEENHETIRTFDPDDKTFFLPSNCAKQHQFSLVKPVKNKVEKLDRRDRRLIIPILPVIRKYG